MNRGVASRYQPALVALHWLLALMIIGLLCLGFFVLAKMTNFPGNWISWSGTYRAACWYSS